MKDLFHIFQEMRKVAKTTSDFFDAISVPFSKRNKLGVSLNGYPVFFIESYSDDFVTEAHLECVRVLFNQDCVLKENGKTYQGLYDIIYLDSDDEDLQRYFIDIISLVIKKLPSRPKPELVRAEVKKLVELFRLLTASPVKTVQGLWAEMLLIARSKNVDYMINAWHVSSTDKYDFNDGVNKLEVKSTSGMERKHHFALDQLNANMNSGLIIASLFAVQSGGGSNIFQLRDAIAKKTKDDSLIQKMNDIILQTLGKAITSASDIYFDYELASESLNLYDGKKLPKILPENVPDHISSVHFVCDLTNEKRLKKTDSLLKNKLYGGLL